MKKSELKNIIAEEVRLTLINEMDDMADEVLFHIQKMPSEDAQDLIWNAYQKGHLSSLAAIKIAKATGGSLGEIEQAIKEVTSQKQKQWACAQINSKNRSKGLSKAQAEEMCRSEVKEEILRVLRKK